MCIYSQKRRHNFPLVQSNASPSSIAIPIMYNQGYIMGNGHKAEYCCCVNKINLTRI